MSFIELYRQTLEQIAEQEAEYRGEGNLLLEIRGDQVQIVHLLGQEGAISLIGITTPEAQYQFEGPHDPNAGHLVEYEPLFWNQDDEDEDYTVGEPVSIRARLIALDEYESRNAKFLGNTTDDRAVRLAHSHGFVSYAHKLITYKGAIVLLSPIERAIFAELLYYVNDMVELADLCESAGIEYAQEGLEDSFSKTISRLNGKLDEIIGYKPITNDNFRRRWGLSLKDANNS